jgi:putative tryptophan/tyrosine transport system substrate-binding protein
MIRRRQFIAGLGGAAAWPLLVRAQQPTMPVRRIGVLIGGTASDPFGHAEVAALREQLLRLGWDEGRNIGIELRFGEADFARYRTQAAELVAMNPEVLLSDTTPVVQEFQKLTRTIPIVFAGVFDPVASSFVASLAHPGGNATGFMNTEPAISARWLQLLKEIAPNLSRMLVLVNAGTVPNQIRLRAIEEAAPSLGVQVQSAVVRSEADIESAIRGTVGQPNVGLIVPSGFATLRFRKVIFEQAVRYRLPAIYQFRDFVVEGGLMSYGPEPGSVFWGQASTYVDRILRGEKPWELLVQAPTTFALVINVKTAKAMALPEAFLLRADEVIE